MVLIHEAGSLNGLIGNSVMVGKTLDGFACTNNMVRVVAENDIDAGYIFSALSNVFGIRLIKREAAGSAIPHIDESRISALEIPWPNSVKIRTLIAGGAVKARDLSDQANELESKSQQLLINEIESPE